MMPVHAREGLHVGCRLTNTVTQGPDTDALRQRILAPEADVVPRLIEVLSSPGVVLFLSFILLDSDAESNPVGTSI